MWLYIPSAFVPEPECLKKASELPVKLQDWGGYAPYVTSSGKPTQQPCSWQGWKRRPWIKRLSGMTLKPSMAQHGLETWISSLADTPASRFQLRVSNSGPKTPDTCGLTLQKSSGKPSRNSASLRTSEGIFDLDLNRSTMNFDQWATALGLACSQRKKLARLMNGADFLSLLTARKPAPKTKELNWPTATANDWKGPNLSGRGTASCNSISTAVKNWGTPTGRDYKDGSSKDANCPTNGLLGRQVIRDF